MGAFGAGCTGAACGTLSGATAASGAAVNYTAPATLPNPPTVTLTATAVDDSTKSAKATITLAAAPAPPSPPSVSVTPGTANLATGGVTQTFTANVSNDAQNLGVTWSVSGTNCTGAACGSISPTTSASGAPVTYTSATRATAAGTVTVIAAAVAEASSTGAAAVTLAAPTAPTVTPTMLFTPVAVSDGFGEPAIATDSSGNIYIAWLNFDGVHFRRSTDGGATFSNDKLIPSDLGFNAQNNLMNMVVDPVGNIDLLWFRDVDGSGMNISYYISRSSDNGATFTAPLQFTVGVFQQPKIVATSGRQIGRDVEVDSSSNVVAETTSDGVMLSAPTTIAAAVPGVAGEQIIVGPDGHVYVFWETSIAASSCSISFSSSADAAMYTPAKTISGGAGACNSQPSASVDSSRQRRRDVDRGLRRMSISRGRPMEAQIFRHQSTSQRQRTRLRTK